MSEPTASAHNDEDPFAALKVSLPKDKKKLLRKKRKRLDLSDNNTDSSHSKDTEDDDEEEPQSVLERVREAKEFRLIRTRQHGTDMSADAISMGAAKKKRDDEVLASLDETFTTKQNNVMSITDKRMEEYIERELAKRRKLGEQGLPEVSQQQLQELLAKEAELEKKTRTLADGTIVGEGGLLKIEKKESVENTTHYIPDSRRNNQPGVIEVELGEEYKRKNWIETEEALKKLASQPRAPERPHNEESEIYTVNYAKYSLREYRERTGQQKPADDRPTDDIVYDRFRKRLTGR